MRAFGAMPLGFVKAGHLGQIYGMGRFNRAQHGGHASIEIFGPKNVVIPPAIMDKGADMPRHGRPMNVRLHRPTPAYGIAGKQ